MFSENNIWAHVDMEFLSSCSTRYLARSQHSLLEYRVECKIGAMYYFNLLDKRRRPLLTIKVADFFNKGWWKKKSQSAEGLEGQVTC